MADNVGPPVSGGSQGRNLEDVSILTWSKDNVKAWLKKEDYSKCIDSLAELNGKRLAKARIETLTTYLGDKAVAMDLWEAVGVLLLRQQKKNLFEDYDEYESIMDTRGTPVQSGIGLLNDNEQFKAVTTEIGISVAKAVVAANKVVKTQDEPQSLKSASKLSNTEKTKLKDACEFTNVDFLSEVKVDDSKIRNATDMISKLWTATEKPSWFPLPLWEKKRGYTSMEQMSESLIESTATEESNYEYLINWVVRCAFLASGYGKISPEYQHGATNKPVLEMVKGSVSRRCGCSTASPDGFLQRDALDVDGVPIEAKPAFNGTSEYTLNSLRERWSFESLCQIEGTVRINKRYGVGVLSSWKHWVFMKAIRPKGQDMMQVKWCSLELDGEESLKTMTIYVLKLLILFSLPENQMESNNTSDNTALLLEVIDEVDDDSTTNEDEPDAGFGDESGGDWISPAEQAGGSKRHTLAFDDLIFLDVFSDHPTLDEAVCMWRNKVNSQYEEDEAEKWERDWIFKPKEGRKMFDTRCNEKMEFIQHDTLQIMNHS